MAITEAPGDFRAPRRRDPYADRTSIEFRFRERRFAIIRRMLEAILDAKGRADIVDLGGTEGYWLIGQEFLERNRARISITLVNTEDQPALADPGMFRFIRGSATAADLMSGQTFDLVHSNSVIEHVGRWSDMVDFAATVRRLSDRYYVQTPNYWFAYEPHFRFPGFQYLPEVLRVQLLMRMPLGFFRRIADRAEAQAIVDCHRLLSTRQMRTLFHDGEIIHEKLFGLNKSIIAVRSGQQG